MKKITALLMALLVLISVFAVPASAEEAAETTVSVKKGDEVVYDLKVTVPEKVVGCDFSVYFDSSALKVKEIADFTGNFDSEEWQAVINPNLKDQIIGNWSIISGIPFDNRSLITVKFEATANIDTHISYYVRYMYPKSLEQFTDYTFTCDVTVNGKTVVEDAAPELNVEEPQSSGQFVNSVTGDGEDANVNTAEKTPSGNSDNGGEKSENDVTANSGNSGNSDSKDTNNKETTKSEDKTDATEEETSVSSVGDVDTPDEISATVDQDSDGGIFTSVWFWVIIAIVIIGGGAGVFFVVKKKK